MRDFLSAVTVPMAHSDMDVDAFPRSSGFQVAQPIRAAQLQPACAVVIVALTGQIGPSDHAHCLTAVMAEYPESIRKDRLRSRSSSCEILRSC